MTADLCSRLPAFYGRFLEMRALLASEGAALEEFSLLLPRLAQEAAISEASASRIAHWESLMEIVPQGSLAQRRMMVLARLRGQGKLNSARIKQIAHSFTGDLDAQVELTGSELRVRILPPNRGEVFRFPDLERALKPLIPAHLNLLVVRFYNTWGDRKAALLNWEEIASAFLSWAEVANEIMEG